MTSQPPGPVAPRIFILFLNAIFAAALTPTVLYWIVSILYRQPMNGNEGWNVFFVSKLLSGQPLYVPLDRFPLTPLNYPPLSYFFIAGLSAFTGDILLTGRIVTLLSSAVVAAAIYGIVKNVTGHAAAAVFASLFWVCLMARFAPARLVMYDPQMLAHAFSAGALWLYSRWRGELTSRRIWIIAAACCVAVFIKHLLVAVPATLAAALFLDDRQAFRRLAFYGLVIGTAFAATWLLYGGRNAVLDFMDTGRPVLNAQLFSRARQMFMRRFLIVAFGPFLLLLANFQRQWTPYAAYFAISLVIGAYTARGIGVDTNAWFDFFIAASVLFGVLAGSLSSGAAEARGRMALRYLVLLTSLLPLASGLPNALRTIDYGELRRSEEIYRNDVALLRSIPGPALFDSLLLGYDAGKEFLLDPINTAQLIVMGRVRESLVTDAIKQRQFAAVVLNADLERALCGSRYLSLTMLRRWSPGSLAAIAENYRRLENDGSPRFFYVPRAVGDIGSGVCRRERRLS
jgi:Dolichyl-phosphate-mannose-protein mannosyltransferase